MNVDKRGLRGCQGVIIWGLIAIALWLLAAVGGYF